MLFCYCQPESMMTQRITPGQKQDLRLPRFDLGRGEHATVVGCGE